MSNIFKTLYKRVPLLARSAELCFLGGELPEGVLESEPLNATHIVDEEIRYALDNPELSQTVNGNLVFRLGGLYNAIVDNGIRAYNLNGYLYLPVPGGYLTTAKYEVDYEDETPDVEVVVDGDLADAAIQNMEAMAGGDETARKPFDLQKGQLVLKLTADFVGRIRELLFNPATGKLEFPKLWDFGKLGTMATLTVTFVRDIIAIFK